MRVKRLYGKAKVLSCFRWNERDCGNSPRWRTDGALNQKQTMVKNSKLFAISAGFKPFLLTACEHLRANSWAHRYRCASVTIFRTDGVESTLRLQRVSGWGRRQRLPIGAHLTSEDDRYACEVNAGRNRARKRWSASTFSSVSAALPVQWISWWENDLCQDFCLDSAENGANTYKKQQPRF